MEKKLRDATLLFLVKRERGKVTSACLALKLQGFGVGKLSGVGGKVEDAETIEDATKREANEEISIQVGYIQKCAELTFIFPHNTSFSQLVHVFLTEDWEGEPMESEEMRPSWHIPSDIPFHLMWSDGELWLPKVLGGELLRGSFTFAEDNTVSDYEIKIVDGFE